MCKIVVLNTTAINVSQLSYIDILCSKDKTSNKIYAHLNNHFSPLLQDFDDFDDAVAALKEFSQKCNGTYRPPMPMPPGPE